MGAYIIRRILISIPVLIGITIIGFVALKLAPGDPLLSSVNPETLANLLSHPEILEAEPKAKQRAVLAAVEQLLQTQQSGARFGYCRMSSPLVQSTRRMG